MIISDGYNGTPMGFENCCEDEEGKTHTGMYCMQKPCYIKAGRFYSICKRSNVISDAVALQECSKLILQAGITRLVYINEYSDDDGISFLRGHNIEIEQVSDCELKNKHNDLG
jgi:dCMP deaminase